jgi:hypothetical protein
MTLVERAAERVARGFDRRAFLNRSAATTFAFATAFAYGGFSASSARADGTCPNNNETCGCNPSGGTYCNSHNSAYCSGATCAGGCTKDLTLVWPGNGCWCSKECCYQCSNIHLSYCGYYTCCDCHCPGGLDCSCRSFTYTCRNCLSGDCPVCC